MIIKHSYIKQIGPKKFRVYSEKGKNMGTYPSKEGAKKRLSQIEYFKHQNSADDNHVFSRGGEGGVPEFFRRNLDYGERDEALAKRLKKLRTAGSALNDLGFKKEAKKIKDGIKSLLLKSFLIVSLFGAGVHAANESLTSGRLMELSEEFAMEESSNVEEKKSPFDLGTPTEVIISSLYSNIPLEGKEQIILDLLKEYNPNLVFEGSGLQLRQEPLFKYIKRAEVAYPDLKKIMDKFSERLSSGYDITEVGEVGRMSISEDARKALMSAEGFSSKIYNDNKKLKWPIDKEKGSGHWTIGYGHLLTEIELDSGIITLKDESRIKWSPKLSEGNALKIKANDLILNSLLAAGLSEDTKISRPMFDALTDLSFNVGPGALSRFIISIKDESGDLSPDLFAKNISGWTKVDQKNQRKGILIRRISELLTAKGVLLPEDPDHVLRDSISTQSKMILPNKATIHDYLKSFDDNNTLTEAEAESVLNALSESPPNSPSEFVETVNKVI
jgi:GH24 family phage-related lysozyme (muramidase)